MAVPAIHDAYDHKWELDGGTGYLRFQPGPNLQRLTYYAWDVSATRFHSERLGYTLDGRGYYGYAFVGVNRYSQGAFTGPEISMYNVLGGPIYRFYLQPRFAVSGRVLGGWAYGNFGGDVSTATPTEIRLFPNGNTYAASVSVIGEYNLSPAVSFKLAPEYFFTGFGSTLKPAEDSRAEWWSGGGNSKNSSQFVVHRSPSLFSVHSSHSPYVPSP